MRNAHSRCGKQLFLPIHAKHPPHRDPKPTIKYFKAARSIVIELASLTLVELEMLLVGRWSLSCLFMSKASHKQVDQPSRWAKTNQYLSGVCHVVCSHTTLGGQWTISFPLKNLLKWMLYTNAKFLSFRKKNLDWHFRTTPMKTSLVMYHQVISSFLKRHHCNLGYILSNSVCTSDDT